VHLISGELAVIFTLVVMWRVPPWPVVILGAVAASVAAIVTNGTGIQS
jgi:hypothetical protein